MAKVAGDPAELRRFARDLTRFNNDQEALIKGLQSRLSALSNTWRDQEHKKFTEQFEQTLKALKRFQGECQQHISFLMRKAQALEEYLG